MGGKTSSESKAKYNAKAYDRTSITFKKGKLEKIKAHAESLGMSLNAYIVKLVEKDMDQPL